MATVDIHEANADFSRLLARVADGEEIIIAEAGRCVARLVACEGHRESERVLGRDAGLFTVPDDFDAPLPDDASRQKPRGFPMTTMNVSLPPDLASFVEEQIASGRYESCSEYVGELVRQDQGRRRLRELVLDGAASAPTSPADNTTFNGLRDRVRERGVVSPSKEGAATELVDRSRL
ncbi:MAG: antitoxin ParD1/3/4 [Myxococcota bacterium]|jgi:antitoxin ParD1/3/4